MRSKGGFAHWLFHFIVLPVIFAISIIGIISLASIFLSPGGYYDGNALDALRSWMPVSGGVLLVVALLSLLTFVGLYGWRKWSLVTLIVLLVLVIAGCIAMSAASWIYLAEHGTLLAQVDARLAHIFGYMRAAGIIAAVIALLFLIYYVRRARVFVTAAELREQRKLAALERW